MKIVLLGAPGAGKGTQAVQICEKYDIVHISTGAIFRKHISEKTELGNIAALYIDRGQLVPDELTIDLVKLRLAESDCKNGFLLDGFPRTITQAKALEQFCDVHTVINIVVPFEELKRRLTGRRICVNCAESYHKDFLNGKPYCIKCGGNLIQRDDDDEETVVLRLEVYEKQTASLIDFYNASGLLRVIDGNQPMDKVLFDIGEALKR